MEQELAHLTRRLADLGPPPLMVGDGGDRAVACEVYEVLSAGRERMLERARALEAALERIATGVYGVCVGCGEPIARRRLAVLPEAARCTPCQEIDDKERETRRSARTVDAEDSQ